MKTHEQFFLNADITLELSLIPIYPPFCGSAGIPLNKKKRFDPSSLESKECSRDIRPPETH